MPGCSSASEISQAEELGVEICKIFPGGSVGGTGFVKDILGPMPWSRIMPSGGVEPAEESLSEWFKAGVACVGLGSKMFPMEVIAAGNFGTITENVTKVCHWIDVARDGKSPLR